MRVVNLRSLEDARGLMRRMQVDPYGIRIMAPKALMTAILVDGLEPVAANILKQEMLSAGADAAIARHALTARRKKTDCLLFGTLAQFRRLADKLKRQPFGLSGIGRGIRETLNNHSRSRFVMTLGTHRFSLGEKTRIMGIVNVTPDSFSGDGLLAVQGEGRGKKDEGRKAAVDAGQIAEYAERMVADGADMIDIGGESSRPGARAVDLQEEIARVIPAVRACARRVRVPISVDTSKPEVAQAAIDQGAVIINDIRGLKDPRMAKVAASTKAGVVIMHMRGEPRTMQRRPRYDSVTGDIIAFFYQALERARAAGISRERIMLDPGICFGKTIEHNLTLLNHLAEFKVFGLPLAVGTSRKSFIGAILKSGPAERLSGTVASCVVAAMNGAHVVRVHDVKAVKQALSVCQAIRFSPH